MIARWPGHVPAGKTSDIARFGTSCRRLPNWPEAKRRPQSTGFRCAHAARASSPSVRTGISTGNSKGGDAASLGHWKAIRDPDVQVAELYDLTTDPAKSTTWPMSGRTWLRRSRRCSRVLGRSRLCGRWSGKAGKEQEIGDGQVSCPPESQRRLGMFFTPSRLRETVHVTVFSRVPSAPRRQVEGVRGIAGAFLVLPAYARSPTCDRGAPSGIRTGFISALKGPNLVAQGNALGS